MSTYSIQDIIQSTDRYKLYTLLCPQEGLAAGISWLEANHIPTINIGKALASFIDGLEDFSYLHIDVFDYMTTLLNTKKAKINHTGNDVIAVYNLGILLEPALELNAAQWLKDYSRAVAVIILWENQSEIPDCLHWPGQQNQFFLDFTETPLKKISHVL
jgi:hypothetical protein